jgi:hypothetical protein
MWSKGVEVCCIQEITAKDMIQFATSSSRIQTTDIRGDLDPNMTLLRQKMDEDETRSFSLSCTESESELSKSIPYETLSTQTLEMQISCTREREKTIRTR